MLTWTTAERFTLTALIGLIVQFTVTFHVLEEFRTQVSYTNYDLWFDFRF